MKNTLKTLLFSLTTFIFSIAMAQSPEMEQKNTMLLDILKAQTGQCALLLMSHNKSGYQNIVGFKSVCPSLNLINDFSAQIFANNQWYSATIITSEEADSFDLNHLFIKDSFGNIVATRTNVASFNSVVLALTGGEFIFQKKFIDP